jgi:hypothetical protein
MRTAQRATAESLRADLDTAHAEITRVRAENTTLHQHAARHFGEQRAITRDTAPASRRWYAEPARARTPCQRHVYDAELLSRLGSSQTDLR